MSCRVAGKYVESALFGALLKTEGCEYGTFDVEKTKKNILLRRTLEEIGFKFSAETEKKVSYQFSPKLKNKQIVSYKEK